MTDELHFLKIKIKSLAGESKIIRHAEKRKPKCREQLYLHRVNDVRVESRAALLAYGFLRGRTWHRIEGRPKVQPDWERVERMIKKYGVGECRTNGSAQPDEQLRAEQTARFERFKEYLVLTTLGSHTTRLLPNDEAPGLPS